MKTAVIGCHPGTRLRENHLTVSVDFVSNNKQINETRNFTGYRNGQAVAHDSVSNNIAKFGTLLADSSPIV